MTTVPASIPVPRWAAERANIDDVELEICGLILVMVMMTGKNGVKELLQPIAKKS